MRIAVKFLTHDERQARYQARKQWHTWYAWRPAYVHDLGIVWLETVERKGTYSDDSMGGCWWYDYRPLGSGGE